MGDSGVGTIAALRLIKERGGHQRAADIGDTNYSQGVHTPQRRGLWVVAMAATLVACGGGDDPTAEPTTTTTSVVSTTVTSAPAEATGPTAITTTPTVFTTTPPETVTGPATLTDAAPITTAGMGPVIFGTTVASVEGAIGTRLLPDPSFAAGESCIVVAPEAGPTGVTFTVANSSVQRVDITAGSAAKTRSGAGIGTTEAELIALFGNRLTNTIKPDSGRTVVFTPQDAANAPFRVIFELDTAGVVVSLRSGRVGTIEPLVPCT